MDFYCDEGIPYSFDIELPDLGELGMLLSPSDILEVIWILKNKHVRIHQGLNSTARGGVING